MNRALFLYLAITQFAFSQDPVPVHTSVPAPSSLEIIRESILGKIRNGELVSMAVAVSKGGQIVWEEAFGFADKERKIPATPNSIYAIGSLSKSLVSTGMMKLIDREKVHLTDSADRYLAPTQLHYFAGGHATVAHIMGMSAGIPHGWFGVPEEAHPKTSAEKERFFSKIALSVFPPGQVYDYSNNSMGFVQLMIEHISGKDLREYMHDEVFIPLGMSRTLTSYDPALDDEIVTGYTGGNIPRNDSYFLPEGGGGFYSTAHDLILFGMFHLKDHLQTQKRIMSDRAIDLMHTYELNAPDKWHLGFFGDSLIQITNGSIGGANAHLQLKPRNDIAVVCLTNKSTSLADEFAGRIVAAIAPDPQSDFDKARSEYMAKYANPYVVTRDLLGTWFGYVTRPGWRRDFLLDFRQDGKVYALVDGKDTAIVTNMIYNTVRQFRGNFSGSIPLLEADPATVMNIQLKLMLRGNELSGYVSAIFSKGGASYSIPSFVMLKRAEKDTIRRSDGDGGP